MKPVAAQGDGITAAECLAALKFFHGDERATSDPRYGRGGTAAAPAFRQPP